MTDTRIRALPGSEATVVGVSVGAASTGTVAVGEADAVGVGLGDGAPRAHPVSPARATATSPARGVSILRRIPRLCQPVGLPT